MSNRATLPIIGGPLDGQQATSCPPDYHLQAFFFHHTEAFAFVADAASFEDARNALFAQTRKSAAPFVAR